MVSSYSVSKAALYRLAENLAAETRALGVQVFAINPGLVRTAMTEYGLSCEPSVEQFFDGLFASGADVAPERAGQLVICLASVYLIKEIESTARVHVRLHTEIAEARGGHRISQLVLRDRRTRQQEAVPAAALFVMIGAIPHTDWLPGSIARDRHGFILTGGALPGSDSAADARRPLPLETSLPGVFAAGDVRAGSVKRVASAVGEGSVSIPQVHQYLQRQATQPPAFRSSVPPT